MLDDAKVLKYIKRNLGFPFMHLEWSDEYEPKRKVGKKYPRPITTKMSITPDVDIIVVFRCCCCFGCCFRTVDDEPPKPDDEEDSKEYDSSTKTGRQCQQQWRRLVRNVPRAATTNRRRQKVASQSFPSIVFVRWVVAAVDCSEAASETTATKDDNHINVWRNAHFRCNRSWILFADFSIGFVFVLASSNDEQ